MEARDGLGGECARRGGRRAVRGKILWGRVQGARSYIEHTYLKDTYLQPTITTTATTTGARARDCGGSARRTATQA